MSASSYQISPFWLTKCGPTAPKIAKIGIFGINLPKRVYPLMRFLQNLAWGRESQVSIVIPNFTILALKKCGLTTAIIAKNRNFWHKFAPVEKFWGSTEKVEYRCTTTNFPACNNTIIVLIRILLHSVSVITNFVTPKRDKQTIRQTKNSHFFVYSRRATHDPNHTWHGDRGGPYHFCIPLTFFDPISSFAARGY